MDRSEQCRLNDQLMAVYRAGVTRPEPSCEALVERVQEVYSCILRGDFQALGSLMTEDVFFEIHALNFPRFHGSSRGRAEVIASIERNFGQIQEQCPEIREVVVQGETVMILGRETGKCHPDGNGDECYSVSWIQFLTFRDGQLCLIRENVT